MPVLVRFPSAWHIAKALAVDASQVRLLPKTHGVSINVDATLGEEVFELPGHEMVVMHHRGG